MKKSFFFVAALALTFAACNPNEPEQLAVADFENLELAPESSLHFDQTLPFISGGFEFMQEVSFWGTTAYFYGNVPTNKTSNEYKGDYDNDKSASGGAHSGNNFVVWTASYNGSDGITLVKPAVVPGFYVNNTPWVVDAILHGDGMSSDGSAPFGANDFFKLTITGTKADGSKAEVIVDLAKGTEYIKDWTYVDLSSLGKISSLKFALSSSKNNEYGMTTPAYFALDDFGASKQ